MKILKFGGSSVANTDRIKSVIQILLPLVGKEPIAIVFSAFGGVTDMLIRLSNLALAGDQDYKLELEQLEKRHLDAVRDLIGVQRQSSFLAQVKFMINELDDILHGVYLVKERTPRTVDYIMSFGERLSTYIISEAFCDRGIAAEFLDARTVVRTDNHFGHAKVDFETTNLLIRNHFASHPDLQIVTGFIGTSESGETTTLGRSGSDYTAAIFAGALRASSLGIWTDVDGMMTADPGKVKKAFTVKEMTYEEAMELSHFGAKVIFPSTMQPAMANSIPIWIKNSFNPSFVGTKISEDANGRSLIIKGISSMNNISLISVQGSGLLGVVGVSMRLFATLAREKINVILISQASSEHSICLAIDGENMKHNPGTSGRMFNALGKNGINIIAIAQGSSELNISTVVQESDIRKALNVLHEAFFLSDRKVLNLFLVGTGLIGKSLVKMIADQFAQLSKENLLEVNLIAVANSKRMLFNEMGLELDSCVDQMKREGETMALQTFLDRTRELNLSNSVFVDC